jgi:hypothetical protein
VDRSGVPVLVALADADADGALLRLLDHAAWIGRHFDLLARAHPGGGLAPGRSPRCFLVAPAIAPAFLERLPLLSIEVVPYVARPAASLGPGAFFVERAAALFGLEDAGAGAAAEALEIEPRDAAGGGAPGAAAFGPADGAEAAPPDVVEHGPPDAAPGPDAIDATDLLSGAPLDDDGSRRPAAPAPEVTDAELLTALPDEPLPAEPFETLTGEELAEFERFERLRREGGGRTP